MVARGSKKAGSSSGGIAKRRSAARTDRDGDLVMDSAAKRGGIGKSRGSAGKGSERGGKSARVDSASFQREVLRHVASNDRSMRNSAPTNRGQLEELKITGWTNSKASNTNDRGVGSLIDWLEKKAKAKSGPSKKPVKIKKSRVEGDDTLIISVPSENVPVILRMNGFAFAGANIEIKRVSGEAEGSTGSGKESTVQMLKGVLERRYNPTTKLLDLSALGQDQDLKAAQIFDSKSTTSKFFPALMKVLDQQFKTATEKQEAIESVSLAHNDLPNLSAVTTLAQTLPQLRNLDLSHNAFKDTESLSLWRRKFRNLDHLVITNNPLEQAQPDYSKEFLKWYPKLRLLNTIQIRTDEEAAKGTSASVELPFPIRTPIFQDEGQIAETFIRTFFTGFDADRPTLATMYYDSASDFSFAVNTQAPRDPASTASAPQDWDPTAHIRSSRNLKKIQQLPARQTRHFRGPEAVAKIWSQLPATRHPDLAAEARKWLVECQSQPGVPDPTGQSPVGVDGFLITIHGEFVELDRDTKAETKRRSFDRSFVIGPGGPTGVRVVCDMLTIRAYGGVQAFEPETLEPFVTTATAAAGAGAGSGSGSGSGPVEATPLVPALPPGVTLEAAEQMVLEVQKRTGMTVGYAQDCLEQVGWVCESALGAFEAVRANLPPEAFVQQ